MTNSDKIPAREQVKAHARDTFRMTLTINGTAYRINGTFGPGPHTVGQDAVKSFGVWNDRLGECFFVAQRLTGNTCNCPAFQDNATCMHVRCMVAAGLLDDGFRPHHARPASPDATLAGLADHEADAYRDLGTPEGDLFARTMEELALKIRLTRAASPDEYDGRIAVLDADIRERWEARGYEEGRRSGCRCGENAVE